MLRRHLLFEGLAHLHCTSSYISLQVTWKVPVSLPISWKRLHFSYLKGDGHDKPIRRLKGEKCNLTLTWAHLLFLTLHVHMYTYWGLTYWKCHRLDTFLWPSFKVLSAILWKIWFFSSLIFCHRRQTPDRQKVMHKSSPCMSTDGLKIMNKCKK